VDNHDEVSHMYDTADQIAPTGPASATAHRNPPGTTAEPRGRGTCSWEFPRLRTTPSRARNLVRDTLAGWRIGGEATDAVELIVSELVTNAVIHTFTSHVRVWIARLETAVILEVVDDGPAAGDRPTCAAAGEVDGDGECGRGLFLVSCAAAVWGSQHAGQGTAVWARVDLSAAGPAVAA
jgi:anti-sigma regulatory factor (Ser/Thr protein kinase)